MPLVQLLMAVKTDDPYVIVGDKGRWIALSDEAADWAIRQGWAVDTGQTVSYEAEPLIPEPAVIPEPVIDPELPAEPPKRPYGNAPKSDWVTYAVAVDPDLSQERAMGMTKNDLMAKYGERL